MKLPLRSPDYFLASRRAKTVNINIRTPTSGEIAHLVIYGTGLKVFGEGEWKVKQHGAEGRREWSKLHLAVDRATHKVICANLSLSGTTDAQPLPRLIKQITPENQATHSPAKWRQVLADKYRERNHAVVNQRLNGSNNVWKTKLGAL